jgi:pimeloyl-ACP methyl ester carboxylesterase
LRSIAADPHLLERASHQLRGFERPALVICAKEDRVMPPEHGQRLAQLLPAGHYIEIADSYTLIALDQPMQLARHLRDLARRHDPLSGSRLSVTTYSLTPRARRGATGESPR